ncbi:MAG TPA: hypothetical protein VGL05_30135 [Kribbella sp.]
MISQVSETPCWVIRCGDDGEGALHSRTFEEAEETARELAADHERTYTVKQLRVPCWTATCDGDGCIAEECNEDGWAVHIPADNRRHALSDLQELRHVDGRLLCSDCYDQEYPPAEPLPAPTGRPTIITHDELGRAFGLLLHLVDQIPGTALFDPDTHNALAKVETFVTRRPAAAPAGWAVHVGPFAVQPPLPLEDLPAAPITGKDLR